MRVTSVLSLGNYGRNVPMPMTPEERSRAATRAALIRWSKEDPTPNARRGQAGLLRKFEREVDPEQQLDPLERRRRAECARRAHMIGLAQKRYARAASNSPAPDDDDAV